QQRPPAAPARSSKRGEAGRDLATPGRRSVRARPRRGKPRRGVRRRRRGGRHMDDALAEFSRAWQAAPDAPYRLDPAPRVPVWFGGSAPAVLRRTAAMGDGWVPLFVSPEEYQAGLDRLDAAAVAAGRAPEDIVRAVVLFARVGTAKAASTDGTEWLSSLYRIPPRAFERNIVSGPADDCAEAIDAFWRAGAQHVVVMVAAEDALDNFEALLPTLGPGPSRSAIEVSA